MNEIKPIVICIDNACDNDVLKQGYGNTPLAAYIRHECDCDVLLFSGIHAIWNEYNWRIIRKLHETGLVIAIIISPTKYIDEGNDVEKFYTVLDICNIKVSTFVLNAWSLETPVIPHDDNPLYVTGLQDHDAVSRVKEERKRFSGEAIDLDRGRQFGIYHKLQDVENVMPCSDVVEYSNQQHTPEYISTFESEVEAIRSMSEEERKKFDDDIDTAQGLVKHDGCYIVTRGVGMGDFCQSFAANSWTQDIMVSDVGRNHGVAQIKMQFLIEGILSLVRELGSTSESVKVVGGYVYHSVEGFKTPMLLLNWSPSRIESDPVRSNVARLVLETKFAIPIRRAKVIE